MTTTLDPVTLPAGLLDDKIPAGALEDKWDSFIANSKLVSFEEFCGIGAPPKQNVAAPQQQARK